MKKFTLEVAYDDDFLLYGVVSQEKPHRLAWLINQNLGYNFAADESLEIYAGEVVQQVHYKYAYADEINHLNIYLLQNRDENFFLINELRNVDYFIIIKGALEFFKKTTFTRAIKSIAEVQLITEIKHQDLKQRQYLNF